MVEYNLGKEDFYGNRAKVSLPFDHLHIGAGDNCLLAIWEFNLQNPGAGLSLQLPQLRGKVYDSSQPAEVWLPDHPDRAARLQSNIFESFFFKPGFHIAYKWNHDFWPNHSCPDLSSAVNTGRLSLFGFK